MVSFETAKALKAAGFPQPETVERGQHWYSCGFKSFTITDDFKTGIAPEKWFACYPYFAPTAIDILKEIPGCHLVYRKEGEMWQVASMALDMHYGALEYSKDANPHEAAAKAYFETKKAK